jgi:CDP-glucose 4,6-dehydratase
VDQWQGALEGVAVSVDPTFWRGRRVFLTGHTGFKGSWLSLWLHELGADVTGYALQPPTNPSLFETARIDELLRSNIADIRDLERLRAAMQQAKPEVVLHMAAQPLVRRSYVDPVETYATNVMGTVHLLEAVRATAGVRAVVNVTTDKCYLNREWEWGYRENEPMGGHDPYSSSKGCAELVTAAYRSSFFAPDAEAARVATARAGNVIGGGDWAEDRLLPDVLQAFAAGRPVRLRNPGATRPWQHVLEPLRGYLLLAQRLASTPAGGFDQPWNFGPADGDVQTVQQVVQALARQWGGGARWEVDAAAHPHEAGLLKLDIAKARSRLGWQPLLPLEEGLQWIVDWKRRCDAGDDPRAVTLAQVRTYQARLGSP